jgi:hypothetical protein
MSEKFFDVYLNISFDKLMVSVFNKFDGKIIFFKEYNCLTNFNKNHLNFSNLEKILQNSIREIEKATNSFLNEIYLMIDTEESMPIYLSLIKDNEGNQIDIKNIQYLVQDAKQQILRSYFNKNITHIIIEKYMIDNVEYSYLPLNTSCKRFSIDIKFICFPKHLIKKVEQLFNHHQILINKIICSKYAKKFNINNYESNICKIGFKLNSGLNKQEVVIVPKILSKKGFFEKLFHFFK